MSIPDPCWIFHIVHVDRLPSIIENDGLCCDADVINRQLPGTCIGLSAIKRRRLHELRLSSYTDLYVGDCVPFYFCPRSVMLYLIHKRNPELTYQGGQESIVHLVANLSDTLKWAEQQNRRWAFTTSNAGSRYFEDYADAAAFGKIDWDAVKATSWAECKEAKQAEFLLERHFPWHLIKRIGIHSTSIEKQVLRALQGSGHSPELKIVPEWYY